jgi:antitoxin PrlF
VPPRRSAWEGNAADLVAEANRRFEREAMPALQLNERVLRDYVQRGIVARPQRRGKVALYGRRQLMQVIAARRLIAQGWPLAKIAEHLGDLDQPTLARFAGLDDGGSNAAGLAEDAVPYQPEPRKRGGSGMNTVTVTPKGQIPLPKHILKTLGVRPGDRLALEELPNGQVQLRPAPTGTISDVFDLFRKRGRKPVSIDAMNRATARGWSGRRMRAKK